VAVVLLAYGRAADRILKAAVLAERYGKYFSSSSSLVGTLAYQDCILGRD
jgi:hypothetical protein